MFRRTAAALVFLIPASAYGQDCTEPGYGKALALVESYYTQNPVALFNTQLQVNAVEGRQVLTPDGVWGPASAARVCAGLATYEAVNGMAPDALIVSPEDAGVFVTWMGAMARVHLNPGMLEAPD